MSLLDAVLGDRRQRVAAAGDAERRRLRRSRGRWSRCRAAKASNSNTPTGPFQTMVPADFSMRGQRARGLRADVEDQVVGVDVGDRLHRRRRVGRERLGGDDVDRDRHLGAARLHRLDHGARLADQVGLGQALADRQARRRAGRCWRCRRRRSAGRRCSPGSAGSSAWSRPCGRRRSPPAAASARPAPA